MPNLNSIITQINNTGHKTRLIHPTDVLQILHTMSLFSVRSFLLSRITRLPSYKEMEKILNMHNREEMMDALDNPELNIIPDDFRHFPSGHYVYIFINIALFDNYREIKIGRTDNLHKLIQCYRRLSQRCELVFYRDCKERDDSVLLERCIFRILKEYRVNNINEQ